LLGRLSSRLVKPIALILFRNFTRRPRHTLTAQPKHNRPMLTENRQHQYHRRVNCTKYYQTSRNLLWQWRATLGHPFFTWECLEFIYPWSSKPTSYTKIRQ